MDAGLNYRTEKWIVIAGSSKDYHRNNNIYRTYNRILIIAD